VGIEPVVPLIGWWTTISSKLDALALQVEPSVDAHE
jgi:hypothetical protein